VRRSRLPTIVLAWVLCGVSAAAISLVSVEQEVAIGRQANAQVRKEVPELVDRQVTAYVRQIGRQLVRVAPGPKYPYSFAVANYREINAFALPGGPVWINRGVLQTATNESQLAGVLAHEIAHIAERHAADRLTRSVAANLVLGGLGALLGNTGGADVARIAASFMANGWMLKFSRNHETEADRVGLQMLRRAGWDGRGMVELFEVLRREAGRDPHAVEAFFSSHPPPANRIAALSADVRRGSGGKRDSQEFQAIRARLRKMPAARPMPRD
jgi:predicted Zn-dependent protease